MAPVTFSPVGEAEVAVVRRLASEIWWACYPGIISPEQIEYMLGWMYSEEVIQRELTRGVCYELIVFGHDPFGYLAYEEGAAGDWKLHKLYLLPALQGQGIGLAALEHVCATVGALGGRSLQLTVNKQNLRAIRAYERAGFVKQQAIVNDIGSGFVMDDFLMERTLPAAVSA
jgi:ribosomal protein S18 acetylase RimI-like enzyme